MTNPNEDITFTLSTKEVNIILFLLGEQYRRIEKSKAKKWRPSTKALAMVDIAGLQSKLVSQEMMEKMD